MAAVRLTELLTHAVRLVIKALRQRTLARRSHGIRIRTDELVILMVRRLLKQRLRLTVARKHRVRRRPELLAIQQHRAPTPTAVTVGRVQADISNQRLTNSHRRQPLRQQREPTLVTQEVWAIQRPHRARTNRVQPADIALVAPVATREPCPTALPRLRQPAHREQVPQVLIRLPVRQEPVEPTQRQQRVFQPRRINRGVTELVVSIQQPVDSTKSRVELTTQQTKRASSNALPFGVSWLRASALLKQLAYVLFESLSRSS